MGLLSFLKRKTGDAAPSSGSADASLDNVQQARTRARQRLIGALVLLTVGVIGFPLLFETQPRPIPVDIPINIPSKDSAGPLAMPGARVSASAPAAPTPRAAVTASSPTPPEIITETRAEAGREVPPPKPATAASAPAPSAQADAARAQALQGGKPAAAAAAAAASAAGDARYIVQMGAFADPAVAREARLKIEKLGMKTYTQIAETSAGKRIRVRVGPFATRAEADQAMARARAAGVAAAVLTL